MRRGVGSDAHADSQVDGQGWYVGSLFEPSQFDHVLKGAMYFA
jgi:hypothetical protein